MRLAGGDLDNSVSGSDREDAAAKKGGLGAADLGEKEAESGTKMCRICLDENEDLEGGDPFITPCKCMGSMKYIHLNCLRSWTDSKK